jgi:hypothetical protein
MNIFIVEKNKVAITPEVLLLYPFKDIWKANTLELSLIKFGFIEFMCSQRKNNPFIGYPIDERPDKMLLITFPSGTDEQKEEIKNDPLVLAGIEIYIENQKEASPSLRFYESALMAADSMIDFFATVDLGATNARNGSLLYKPADITRALKDVNDVIKTLGALKSKVIQEINEDAKGKAGREINYFEKSKTER